MSGGANRKNRNQRQGWEEAGAEFYQESYPTTDTDFVENPRHLATLLPSKQTRAAATMRIRNNTDTRTYRRQPTLQRESTARRQSAANDVQVSMMPDLSDPTLTNEERTYQEIMDIKAMPITMAQKKERKAEIQREPTLRLQGSEQFKRNCKRSYERFQARFKETYQKLELWKGTLKTIEGNFGTGVVAYFIFIKWLMFLNLFICTISVLFILLPTILADKDNPTSCDGPFNITECCAATYFNSTTDFNVLDLVQGTGIMERTVFFYGMYTDYVYTYFINNTELYYNLPLAYICVTLLCLLISLIAIVKAASRGFKERLVEGEGQFYHYCNLVFGSWDFCINNEKSAAKKHEAIFKEITCKLEIERNEEERKNRTRDEKTKLIIIRIIVNLIVIIILMAAATGIYFAFDFSTRKLIENENLSTNAFDSDHILKLLYEFLPSITIVLLNIIVPFAFRSLIAFENYSPLFNVRLTMARTVFLRLASLCVLYASLYAKVSIAPKEECTNSKVPVCWETFVGQQMYKLAITDFATHILTTFVVNFIRSRIGRLHSKFAKLIGEQYFDLPKHVLDVVYSQTVCWFGSFYAPLLPAMCTVIFFFMFYIKRFACLVNSKPSLTVYRASRSNSMFMVVLLVSFSFALLPIAFSIAELQPSKSCGPFRGLPLAWTAVSDAFEKTPIWIQDFVYFLTTPGFAIPIFVVLGLSLYYYVAVTSANRHMVTVLKNQLVLEGHDKQFLLDKLSSFIKQQEQIHKRLRQAEMMREGDRNISSN